METTSIAIAFFAGIISFLSPCILPIIPGFLGYLAGSSGQQKDESGQPIKPSRREMFLNSLFFVFGFSFVFAALGVLLNSLLENVSYTVQLWLSRFGGVIIILFGLYLLGLIKIKFLEQDHKLQIKKKFKSKYATSFAFGFAFAVGWTPCVGAVLGTILTLAATQPGIAFGLLLSYAIGLGIPFLLVGIFSSEAIRVIQKSRRFLKYFNYIVGTLLLILGVLVFTQNLARLSGLDILLKGMF